MSNVRHEYLSQRFNEWLDRFAPPRRIQGDAKAMQEDVNAMLQTVLRHAPAADYSDWLDAMLRRLEDGMTTRSWPAPGELARACKASGGGRPGAANDEAVEANCVRMLTEWYERHKSEMPSMGRASRTAAMIRNGVFADEREARFRGFTTDEAQDRMARQQPMGRDEWMRHVRVMAKLRGITESEAAQQERSVATDDPPPAVRIPNKRADTTDAWG